MHTNTHVLGIDIGSVSVSVARLGSDKVPGRTDYEFHHGDIPGTLTRILGDEDFSEIGRVAVTSATPSIVKAHGRYDSRVCLITGSRHLYEGFGAILVVGGEKFGLIRFDGQGDYMGFKSNTACAAGTGGFLDQQAGRLNLDTAAELCRVALSNTGEVPKIATRCAVFAKTDLIHAQQEGYSLAEICDGLCRGLAENIADVLFKHDPPIPPVIFAGGVAQNGAVVKHLTALTGLEFITDGNAGILGAVGAALESAADPAALNTPGDITGIGDLLATEAKARTCYYPPLRLEQSGYPVFDGIEGYEYRPQDHTRLHRVEVDLYEQPAPGEALEAYLGLDIGSTSTKAALLDPENRVLAGFYTRTAGRPLDAVMALFSAIEDLSERKRFRWRIAGAGTTGSGRKFAGKVMGADLILDEITAHARAARDLVPAVDTIIEIGGQDAKFTTLKDGRVTFSVMNTVCAAGTGSFIEEQARKLGCPLSEYATRTEGRRAPMASDRCTVFMERDLNHYLTEGYETNQVLAAVLHSIRENYLTKVAVLGAIGDVITFQGATAKNRALVAAFEQRLKKPIHVSKFCHLTGAVGVALALRDEPAFQTRFRGLGLHRNPIPVRSEVCDFCANHCKLTIADVKGTPAAYGFLCGRDYDTQQFVSNNRSGFDLLRERRKVRAGADRKFEAEKSRHEIGIIGIPAALHLFEDLDFWKYFFDALGVQTLTSEGFTGAVKAGKSSAGAEFCAPMAALHGHVRYLSDRADSVFLPVYLEKKQDDKSARRQYCYYTQFSTALASSMDPETSGTKFLTPLVDYLYTEFYTKVQLYRMFKKLSKDGIPFLEVSRAFDKAKAFKKTGLQRLKAVYQQEMKQSGEADIHVIFLGRPYTLLSRSMNKRIPDIFAGLGVKTFYQDMVEGVSGDEDSLRPLLETLPWRYAAEILKTAETAARTEGAYPVYVTSFKCTPDAFGVEYFKQLMAAHDKPYLILQLDEHDSSVGYETRIEAAVRSFRTHFEGGRTEKPAAHTPLRIPASDQDLTGKTLVLPNWDDISLRLVAANLRREGVDARLMEESDLSVQKALVHNTGQCIPLNIMAQEFIDYIDKYELDPAKTALWMMKSTLSCNLSMFPYHIRNLLQAHGNGMEQASVYLGGLSFMEISVRLPVNNYLAYMFGGLLRRMACKVRPYEKQKGDTDWVLEQSVDLLEKTFQAGGSKREALEKIVSGFEAVDTLPGGRTKVAIFGDLYVRDNDFMNRDLIRFIEAHGGEVITTPYSSYVKMLAGQYLRKWFLEGKYMDTLTTKALVAAIRYREKAYYPYFERILKEPDWEFDVPPQQILSEYHLRLENTGESMDNILKVFYLLRHHPDISLFVQTSPAFCCPSIITEAMAGQIEQKTGVPVVSITYDGTGGNKNDVVIPYLKYPRKDRKSGKRTGIRRKGA
ncbi:MAG: acyl-CoA dehydratase activase [Thermodesulfobacteriota bacterium]